MLITFDLTPAHQTRQRKQFDMRESRRGMQQNWETILDLNTGTVWQVETRMDVGIWKIGSR